MKVFYDCEFLEDGLTIAPISWAGVREDGAELYLIMADARTITRARENEWMRTNVLSQLPIRLHTEADLLPNSWSWVREHPDFPRLTSLAGAAAAVQRFVLEHPEPELWAWYGAYDHVMTAQLFGRMVDLPEGFPMHTNDLKQEADRVARHDARARTLPPLTPAQMEAYASHNALFDAREVAFRYQFLAEISGGG